VAIVGSIAYMVYTVTVRDTSQIPLLASGAVVLSVVFGALAAYSLRATLRAGQTGQDGRAILAALVGGGAAMAAAGFAAGAVILFQVASGP
jgi:ABC-type arginine transport system permease subunit